MHTQYRSNYMHEDQAAMVKMGIGAGGQLLWADLERMVAMATLFYVALQIGLLLPKYWRLVRDGGQDGCAMNPGTKIVGGVAALVASGALALVSRSFRTSWGDGKGSGNVYADKLAGGLPTVCKGITKHTSPDPVVVGDYWSPERCAEVEQMVVSRVS